MIRVNRGLYKYVFKIGNYVVKIPRNVGSIFSILSEQFGYMFCGKKLKKYICPTYFIPFIPINIQPYLDICEYTDEFIRVSNKYKILSNSNIQFKYMFQDVKPSNFGKYNNKIVKIDYGINY